MWDMRWYVVVMIKWDDTSELKKKDVLTQDEKIDVMHNYESRQNHPVLKPLLS